MHQPWRSSCKASQIVGDMAKSWKNNTIQSTLASLLESDDCTDPCVLSYLASVHARTTDWPAKAPIRAGLTNVLCAYVQLGASDVDTTLAVGALNNIIANNNLTAEFGSINTNALLANSTQAALNETLGPIKLYPLRIAAGVTAECTQAYLTPATYYALETAYSGTPLERHPCHLHTLKQRHAQVTYWHFRLWDIL